MTNGSYANAAHFLSAAHLFDEDTLFVGTYNAEEDSNIFNGVHANTTIPKFLGALKGYVVTNGTNGTENYLKYAEKFWTMVVNHHTYITGDDSEWEHFRAVDKLDANRTACNCETCNAYNMLKFSRLLYQITGDEKYMNYYENTFRNTILSSQNPETGMTTYFNPMATGYFKVYSTEFTKFWCCTGSGMESFTKLGDSIYYKKDSKLIVNQFYSSTLNWTEKNIKVQQVSDIPNTTNTTFTIEKLDATREASSIDLYLRIPDWASDVVSVKKDGEVYALTADRITTNGYVIVEEVTAGTTISYDVPMEVVPYTTPDAKGRLFAFKYGPTVLSAELDEIDWTKNTSTTGVEVTTPATKEVESETIGITADDVDTVAGFMSNIKEYLIRDNNASELVFHLTGTNTNLTFTEHYRQHTHRYGIYWYFVKDESELSKAIISGKSENRLNESKVGESIRPGYSQDESAHLTADHSSDSNSSAPNYRVASALNSSFIYTMEVDASRDNYFVTQFSQEDYEADKVICITVSNGNEDSEVIFDGTLKYFVQKYNVDISNFTANDEEKANTFFTAEFPISKSVLEQFAYEKEGNTVLDFIFSRTGLDSQEDSEIDKVVYFVDCGDPNPNTINNEDAFGTRNSVTDQIYGEDVKTGYSWGIVDDTAAGNAGEAPYGISTNHTWPYEYYLADGASKTATSRYTKNQNEDGINRHLEYDFELDAGTYEITTAFANPWNNASPVVVTANDTVISNSLTVPNEQNATATGSVTLTQKGILKIKATSTALCILWNYISIKKTADAEPDTIGQAAKLCNLAFIRRAYNEENSLLAVTVSDSDHNQVNAAVDNENGEIIVYLDESKTEGIYEVLFELADKNGYVALNDFAIDDTKSRKFELYGDEKTSYELKLYAEDHSSFKKYTLAFYAEPGVDEDIVYFVDCGDTDVHTVSEGDKLGVRNSVTEQIYGKDPKTGYFWGIVDDTAASSRHKAGTYGVSTNHTWSNEYFGTADGSAKTQSNRYTKDQYEDGISRHLEYDFELDAGVYTVEAVFTNPWSNGSPLKVKANDTVLAESLVVPGGSIEKNASATGTVAMTNNGTLKLSATANIKCILWCYIIIRKVGDYVETEPEKSNTALPDDTSTITTPAAQTPAPAVTPSASETPADTDTADKDNKVTVKKATISKTQSAKKQTVSLGASATGGTISYKSNTKSVTVSKAGKATIAKNYTGIAKITVTASGEGYQTATATVTIKVKPQQAAISKKTAKSRALQVTYAKLSGVSGYEVSYSTDKKFKKAQTKTVTTTKNKVTVKKLKAKKTYYVRVRAYTTSGKTKLYGAWSTAVKVKTKK